jgi:hypothetical protein
MYCPFCNTEHRPLTDPDGGDGCDPYASAIDLAAIERDLKKFRKR